MQNETPMNRPSSTPGEPGLPRVAHAVIEKAFRQFLDLKSQNGLIIIKPLYYYKTAKMIPH